MLYINAMICTRQLLALLLSFMKAVFVIVVIFRFNLAKVLVQADTACHKVCFTAQIVWTTALGDLLWV